MTTFGRQGLAIELVDDSTPVSAKKFYDAGAKPE